MKAVLLSLLFLVLRFQVLDSGSDLRNFLFHLGLFPMRVLDSLFQLAVVKRCVKPLFVINLLRQVLESIEVLLLLHQPLVLGQHICGHDSLDLLKLLLLLEDSLLGAFFVDHVGRRA